MPLPMPNLDDRRFQDIVDEAKRLIPRYCPQWTDHNVSDPGVTLIELFAWMVEMLLFRLNRVPEKNQIAFMELMGIQLQPPTASRTVLTFWLAAPAADPILVPGSTEISTVQTASEPAISFTTDVELVISPPKLQECLTSPDQRMYEDHFWKLSIPNESFLAFSPEPRPGNAFYLGFKEEHSNHILALMIDCTLEGIGVDPLNPPLVWEAWSGQEWIEAPIDRDENGRLNDETGGLNKRGQVVLHMPPNMTLLDIKGKRAYWLRCRYAKPKAGQSGYSASPKIFDIEFSTLGGMVAATQSTTVLGEIIGRSDGMPGQSFRLEYPPILPRREGEYIEVQEEDGTWTAWTEREDFSESRPSNMHYTLDSVTGEIRFGPFIREPDGSGRQYGAIPPRSSRLRFSRYRSGGGAQGNVEASKLTVLKTSVPYVDRVINRQSAIGGRDAENLERAKLRIPQILRTRNRAVTIEDFERLALEASSGVARARCLQPRAVGKDGDPLPGIVKLLLVPETAQRDSYIMPDELQVPLHVVQAVQSYLDERRLLTTIVQVSSPEYVRVAIDVRLKARRESDLETVRRAATAQLYRFLNPITGGPEYNGWPFGRDLYISQIYAVLQGVVGIEYIERVSMQVEGSDETSERIDVPVNALIASAEHRVVVT